MQLLLAIADLRNRGGLVVENISEGSHPVFIETRPTGAVGTLLDQELRLVHTETIISPSRQTRQTSLAVSEADNRMISVLTF